MKNFLLCFAAVVALFFSLQEAQSARLTLTLSTNGGTLTPIHSRVGFGDTVIVKGLSPTLFNLSVETPLSSTPTIKSINSVTYDSIVTNDLGAYILSVGNVTAYVYTYQKNTITVTYKAAAPSTWTTTATNGTPTVAKLGDDVQLVAVTAASTSMMIRDASNAGYTMTMTAAAGPYLPFTLTKVGLWSVIQFTTVRANITVSNDKVTPTAISLISSEDEVLPYPNPATDKVNFVGYGELFDFIGNKVASGTNGIELSTLANGIYILKVENKSYKIAKK